MALLLFLAAIAILLAGFPVAFSLAGAGLLFAAIGLAMGSFDPAFLEAVPNRIYGTMTNEVLMAVPLFVFMGVMLEKSNIAEELLDAMSSLFGRLRGGLGISVTLVGMLMAASTGIVGATVVTMGLLSLPTMLKRGYDPRLATGTICAAGTLGQIIPPSIVLVLLGDVMSSAYQQSQLDQGIFSPDTVSVGDLFMGALIPGLLLVLLYVLYLSGVAIFKPEAAPSYEAPEQGQASLGENTVFSGCTAVADCTGAGVNTGRAGNTDRSRLGGRCGCPAVIDLQAHPQPASIARGDASHHPHHQHGVFDSDWRRDFLAGVPRLRR